MKKIVLLFVTVMLFVTAFGQIKGGVKSILNQKAPKIVVEKWLGEEPDMKGKFVLLEFWGVNCNPCRKAIPHLNELHKTFKKDMAIVSLCYDTEEKISGMKVAVQEGDKTVGWEKPVFDYSIAIDSKKTTQKALQLIFVPYAIVIDPEGIVRWEGSPNNLTKEIIKELLREYKKPGYIKGQVDVTAWGVKSYLNQKAPELVFGEWMTEQPDTTGKFILFEMFGLFCPPCWEAVPKLNGLHKKFKNQMTIVGVTDTPGKLPQEPHADYYKAVDRKRTTRTVLGLRFVPYALMVDRSGIVRWEGNPNDLTEEIVSTVIKKYKK